MMFLTVVIFILTLLVLVVVHEFGHFIVAKKFKIKVLEFGFGIPPRIWGKKIGETLVSLNWLPIGGFVRLLGEDELEKKVLEDHRSFAAQTVWKRIAVVVAGVAMNFLLACLLFYIVLGFQGFKTQLTLGVGVNDFKFIGVSQQIENIIIIAQVSQDSPASKSGIKLGERVLAINEEPISDRNQLVEKTKNLAGQEIALTLSSPDKKDLRIVRVVPRPIPPQGQGPLGVALRGIRTVNLLYETPTQKLLAGPAHAINLIAFSGKMLADLVGQSFEESSLAPVSSSVAGPVGITSIANVILTSTKNPILPYLDFVALLSLNLAVLNLLPFPALDGGRLFFLLGEAITKKRIHPVFEKWVHTVGMAILLTLALVITVSDIGKIFF